MLIGILALSIFDYPVQDRFEETVTLDKLQGVEEQQNHFLMNEELGTSSEIKSSVQEETWQTGETITYETSYSDSYVDPESFTIYGEIFYAYDVYTSGLHYAKADGTNNWVVYVVYTSSQAGLSMFLDVQIFAGTPGTLEYDFRFASHDGASEYDYMAQQDSSFSVGSEHIDLEGNINLNFDFTANKGASTLSGDLIIFDVDAGSHDTIVSPSTAATLTNEPIEIFFQIDELRFVPDAIESTVRSEYKNVETDTYLHRINIQNSVFNTDITIYKPTHWNLSSISPASTTTLSGNDLTISDTENLNYEITFHSTSPKQYLAIDDKSSDYLSDVGFEGSWTNGWTVKTAYDSVALNSTIVNSGAFSLRLEDTDGSNDGLALDLTNTPSGYYYVSMSVYVESYSGDLYWRYYGSSWGNVFQIDDTIQDRWQTVFFYWHITTTGSNWEAYLNCESFIGVIFLDDFKIWEVNHKTFTSAYGEITTEFYPRSLDGYSNPYLKNFDYNAAFYDRTAGTKIIENNNLKSDANGKVSWVVDTSQYSALQDSREIEVRSFTYENWFGDYYTAQGDSFDFAEGDTEGFGDGKTTGGYSSYLEVNETEECLYGRDISLTVVMSDENVDFLHPEGQLKHIIRAKAVSDSSWYFRVVGYLYGGYSASPNGDTSWQILEWDVSSYTDSGSAYFQVRDLDANTQIVIDYIKLVDDSWYSKSYFTPIISTDFPFYYETDPINEWDFSEETDDSATYYACSDSQSNGYNLLNPSSATVAKFYLKFIDLGSIDASIYTKLLVRVKTNVSDLLIRPCDQSGNVIGSTKYPTINTWEEHEWTLTDDPDWTGTETGFYLFIDENGGDGQAESNNFVWWDLVRLFHRDTPSLSVADSYAYLSSSNNSFKYRAEIDSTLQGYYNDLISFSTDQSVGSHTINATVYDDSDRSLVFIPGTSVTSSYTVSATTFSVQIESFSLSDNYVNTYVTASKDGSYTTYENDSSVGSGSFLEEGTIISHTRDSSAGSLINLAYKFTNGSDTVWFNTSYSNSKTDFYLTAFSINIASTISIVWSTSIGSSTITVIEDGSTKVSDSGSSPATYSKSTNAGIHAVTCRWDLSGYPSITQSFTYEVTAATAFSVTVNSFSLSDSYVNIFVTATFNGNYVIYENDSSVGSGSFLADGTAISHAKDTDYGELINLGYKFTYSGTDIWFNTTYSNADYTHLIVYISTPILVDGRVSIGVTSNLGTSSVNIDDDSKAGTEVSWENEGVFSWYSNIVGENNLTIQVRNDANSDGDYTDAGETWSDTVSYHLYDNDLSLVYASFTSYTDEGATFSFMSNYRGSAKTEYRCKITDDLAFSGWLSEDDYNGTYSFTFSVHDLDTTYNFTVEIRAYITDGSPSYQYKYLRFEFTPYSPDAIVSNPQGINPLQEETTELPTTIPIAQVTIGKPGDMIVIMLVVGGIAIAAQIGLFVLMKTYFENRKEGEGVTETLTRVSTEKSIEAANKATEKTLGWIPGMGDKE